ncbi:MAG: universal stress protein [Dehalococcoidia bacterium]|nr:universal stress protein [Dehalococcoidia bacterium]
MPNAILVPVTNSPASLEALTAACIVGKQRKAKVYVVHIIEVLRSLPLNAGMEAEARRGEQVLRKAAEVAQHAGYQVSGELLQAREAGSAIVDEARDRGVDMIIMGVGYQRMIGSVQMGKTADFVMRNAACQVWLVRPALDLEGGHAEGSH